MALYAIEEDDLISAWDAEKGAVYGCLECFGPVKVRKGGGRAPHFYHLNTSPSCRLYSKGEDHLILQLEIQKKFPAGEIEIEKPLIAINRVADLVWERKKIVFEIQCSRLYEAEAEARIKEYKNGGYDIVWILDDRIFNKRTLRPSEKLLRTRPCYFASLKRSSTSYFYDQFEIFHKGKRVKKGKQLLIDFNRIHPLPKTEWPPDLPSQIEKRIPQSPWYFERDLIDRTLLSRQYPSLKNSLERWRVLERDVEKGHREPPIWHKIFRKLFCDPYLALLHMLLKRAG